MTHAIKKYPSVTQAVDYAKKGEGAVTQITGPFYCNTNCNPSRK